MNTIVGHVIAEFYYNFTDIPEHVYDSLIVTVVNDACV
jgi:homoserine trans-succinylase